jgi:hypothetical protein
LVSGEDTKARTLDLGAATGFLLALERRSTLNFSETALHTHLRLGEGLLRVGRTELRYAARIRDPLGKQLLVCSSKLSSLPQSRLLCRVELRRITVAIHHQRELREVTRVNACRKTATD